MKTIIKALGLFGTISIIFATFYFIELYVDFTQLIVSLGIAGLLILAALVYIYNWMKNKEEGNYEIEEALDRLNMYIRDVEGKLK